MGQVYINALLKKKQFIKSSLGKRNMVSLLVSIATVLFSVKSDLQHASPKSSGCAIFAYRQT